MRGVAVGGAMLHCRVTGPEGGRPLVFSNSLGTDFRIWDEVVARLPAGLRVLVYDKRGHGLSDCPGGEWGMEAHVSDLAGLMEAHGMAGATVCGLSVGGMIAQGLAAARPDLVRAAVLMDTGARIGTAEIWNSRLAVVAEQGIEGIADGILERWFTAPFRAENPAFPLWRNMLVRTPAEGYAKTGAGIRDADFTASTSGLRIPVLGICGESDGSTPPALVRETVGLVPGSRYAEIAKAGHLPCIEQPGETARLLTEFLSETA